MAPQHPESERSDDETARTPGRSEWFYVQRGETYGPVSSTDLRAAALLGFIGPDDLVRRAGNPTWITARSISGLFREAS